MTDSYLVLGQEKCQARNSIDFIAEEEAEEAVAINGLPSHRMTDRDPRPASPKVENLDSLQFDGIEDESALPSFSSQLRYSFLPLSLAEQNKE